ncbi:MAG: hypothetical protein ACTSQJ_17760 [Promethearchaeota archaeon]
MSISDIIALMKKKGFRDTLQILTTCKGFKCERKAFYTELNKFSYYNSFFRVQDELVKRGLIEIIKENGKKQIKLTKKGLEVYNKLLEINDLINNINRN